MFPKGLFRPRFSTLVEALKQSRPLERGLHSQARYVIPFKFEPALPANSATCNASRRPCLAYLVPLAYVRTVPSSHTFAYAYTHSQSYSYSSSHNLKQPKTPPHSTVTPTTTTTTNTMPLVVPGVTTAFDDKTQLWASKLMGKKIADDHSETTFAKSDLPQTHRVLKPDDMGTMDMNPDRLNIHLDDEGTVKNVTHG